MKYGDKRFELGCIPRMDVVAETGTNKQHIIRFTIISTPGTIFVLHKEGMLYAPEGLKP